MTSPFWTPRNPHRAMVAATVTVAAISPVFTSLGTPGIAARAPFVPAALGVALTGLQLRHSICAARGETPRGGLWTLAAMAAIVYVPVPWFTWNWLATQGLLTASVPMVLHNRRLAVTLAALPTLGTALYFPLVYRPFLAPADWTVRESLWEMGWWGIGIPMVAAVVYAAARMVRAARELQAAHTELAELAISQERLRVCRDLHDLIGQSLSAVSLRGDLALRLLPADPAAAQTEIANLTETARTALHDVLAVTGEVKGVDLHTEAEGAKALLAAAGIDARIDLAPIALSRDATAVFGWALREGVTNVLRHSAATTCSITGSSSGDSVWLEIVNDGAENAAGKGQGLTGLAERARAFSGEVIAGRSPGGEFRLLVKLPAEAR